MADEDKVDVEEQPDEDFDFKQKKKKKPKKQVGFEDKVEETKEASEAVEGDAPERVDNAEDDLDAMFADLKKKKKKKPKAVLVDEDGLGDEPVDGEEGGSSFGAAAELDEELDFADMKKKPKKKRNMAEFEAELADGDEAAVSGRDLAEEDDLFAPDDAEGGSNAVQEEAWLKSDRDYLYQELLGRVFKVLRANNPELAGEKKRYTIVPPSVYRDSNKKTVFANVADICKRMHRQPEHVIQFLFAELGTSGSIDGAQRLIIKGRFQPKQIENVLRRYIVEYVTCKTCKSPDTILTKDNRLYFVQCESCGSTRSVSAIKTGFKAVGQGERKAKARAAAS